MEEDMMRLRVRRRMGQMNMVGGVLTSPSDSVGPSTSAVHLGLGTGAGVRDTLPLKSRFFDWCSEYFKEPQMRVSTLCLGIEISVAHRLF